MERIQEQIIIQSFQEPSEKRMANKEDYRLAFAGIPQSNISMERRLLSDLEFEYVRLYKPNSH
jgi:hypothetical protein